MRRIVCKATGCCRTVDADSGNRYCEIHQGLARAELERKGHHGYGRHGLWDDLYQSPKWRQMRSLQLKEHPVCELCGEKATEVHHMTPHNGDLTLFYDSTNLQSLCHECHFRQTQAENKAKVEARRKAQSKLWY